MTTIANDNTPYKRLVITAAANVPNAVEGGYNLFIDSADDVTKTKSATGVVAAIGGSGGSINDYIKVSDVKSSGTAGGTFTAGSWVTRTINTEDSDTGGHCSIASNQITLAAGTYTARISCPAYLVGGHRARLYNSTDVAVVTGMYSASVHAPNANVPHTYAIITGKFVLAASKTLQVEHYSELTAATYGLGVPVNLASTTEVYTVAEFWKIA